MFFKMCCVGYSNYWRLTKKNSLKLGKSTIFKCLSIIIICQVLVLYLLRVSYFVTSEGYEDE